MTQSVPERDASTAGVDAVRAAARARGATLSLSYAGALLPAEAFRLQQTGVKLVDVRSHAELYWVGRVPGALTVEWSGFPGGRVNGNFLLELEGFVAKDEPVMFLCRSGGRSHDAAKAASAAGWRECYNVLEGFEGEKDAQQRRNAVGGWRVAGLPWTQS